MIVLSVLYYCNPVNIDIILKKCTKGSKHINNKFISKLYFHRDYSSKTRTQNEKVLIVNLENGGQDDAQPVPTQLHDVALQNTVCQVLLSHYHSSQSYNNFLKTLSVEEEESVQ